MPRHTFIDYLVLLLNMSLTYLCKVLMGTLEQFSREDN